VIPIFLRKSDFKGMPFDKLQGYPKNAKPGTSFNDINEAFKQIEKVLGVISAPVQNEVEIKQLPCLYLIFPREAFDKSITMQSLRWELFG
jgi:hypothetical protein